MSSININLCINPNLQATKNISLFENIKKISSSVDLNTIKDQNCVVIDISDDGQKRLEASKKNVAISLEEDISTDTNAYTYHPKMGLHDFNQTEAFRLDEPDNYYEFQNQWSKFKDSLKYEENGLIKYKDWKQFSDLSTESQEYLSNAVKIHLDWMKRRCFTNENIQNPVYDLVSNISKLENQLSDSTKQTIIDFYASKEETNKNIFERKWYPQFSIFLSTKMLESLKHSNEQLDKAVLEKIKDAQSNLNKIYDKLNNKQEKYILGAKLYDDGRVTYHAAYYDSNTTKRRKELCADNIDMLWNILNKNEY